eukprot:GHVL01008511.1.p1 GENE.GHVL01008511.1~~GHVL01008511.1.p1  ORF type:complete len:105 (-),score=9.79 GHVL01008511.1:71-385(-)
MVAIARRKVMSLKGRACHRPVIDISLKGRSGVLIATLPVVLGGVVFEMTKSAFRPAECQYTDTLLKNEKYFKNEEIGNRAADATLSLCIGGAIGLILGHIMKYN